MATVFNQTEDALWSNVNNWSAGIPDAADAVTLAAGVTALEIDAASTCLSLNATGPSGACTISGTGALAVAGAITLEAGTTWSHTGAITFTLDAAVTLNFAGKTMPVVNINLAPTAARAHTITPGAGATFTQLNIDMTADRRDLSVAFSTDFSVSSSSSWLGGSDPTYRPLIKSSVPGTGTRIMTVTAASQTITLTDVDLQDIKIADTNTPTVTLTRVGDAGGNTATTGGGYIKNVSDPKTVYAACGTSVQNWYNDIWTTTDGADETERNSAAKAKDNYPLPQDTAIIDDKSWSGGAGNNISSNGVRIGIIVSSLTENHNISLSTGTYYGGISGPKFTITSGQTATFDGRVVSTLTIGLTSNIVATGSWVVNSYGLVQLTAALIVGGTFTLTQGALDLNGQTLTSNIFSSSNTNTRELKDTAGGGKIVVNGLTGTVFDMDTTTGLTVSNAPDIDIGDSNNTLTGNVTFAGGGKTFGDFKVTKYAGDFDCIITGANTFETITLETPDAGAGGTYKYSDIQFTAGTTTTFTSLVADGDATNIINIQSATAATHTLSDSAGTNTVTKNSTISFKAPPPSPAMPMTIEKITHLVACSGLRMGLTK